MSRSHTHSQTHVCWPVSAVSLTWKRRRPWETAREAKRQKCEWRVKKGAGSGGRGGDSAGEHEVINCAMQSRRILSVHRRWHERLVLMDNLARSVSVSRHRLALCTSLISPARRPGPVGRRRSQRFWRPSPSPSTARRPSSTPSSRLESPTKLRPN